MNTHCKHGHEFTASNTRVRANGTRMCRECNARRCRQSNQRIQSTVVAQRSASRQIRKTHQRRRSYPVPAVSIFVRYDIATDRWVHSAGVVLTPTEAAVLAALASAEPTKVACRIACCSEKAFDNLVVILKRRFAVADRSTLTAIAVQLFPCEHRVCA